MSGPGVEIYIGRVRDGVGLGLGLVLFGFGLGRGFVYGVWVVVGVVVWAGVWAGLVIGLRSGLVLVAGSSDGAGDCARRIACDWDGAGA